MVTLFDVFCEVGATLNGGTAVILQKYPDDFNHEQTLKSIVQFSFPCGVDELVFGKIVHFFFLEFVLSWYLYLFVISLGLITVLVKNPKKIFGEYDKIFTIGIFFSCAE